MKRIRFVTSLLFVVAFAAVPTLAQVKRPSAKPAGRTVLFAVLEDGKQAEPIGLIRNGKFDGADGEGVDAKLYGPFMTAAKSYSLVFGGSRDGSLKVVKKLTGECAGASMEVVSSPLKAKLKGFVMAVATDAPGDLKAPSIRRLPTPAERAEAEKLVRAEFIKQKVSDNAVQKLNYHNLTAIDIDRDGTAEMVGSFWVNPKVDSRATLFFIAEKTGDSYQISYAEFNDYTPDEVMSGDVKDLDNGIYHTLLLDYMDIDRDGVGEVITTAQSFEGRNFAVYGKQAGKWSKTYSSYNYRCGY